jgi:hypothetical protein
MAANKMAETEHTTALPTFVPKKFFITFVSFQFFCKIKELWVSTHYHNSPYVRFVKK